MSDTAATIQGEILEIWDWETAFPTGGPVPRETAHRNGTPHEAVHLWVVRNGRAVPEILFQHRAAHKESYPDCLDITVGGHVPYGYGGNKVLKEAEEEIGILPDERDLIDLGWYRYEERKEGLYQREIQHVYLLSDDRELHQFRFRDGEVAGIYAVGLDKVQRVIDGDARFEIDGFNGTGRVRKTVTRGDFHPQLFDPSMHAYMRVVMTAMEELAATGTVTVRMPDL